MNTINAQASAQLAGVHRLFFIEHRHVATWPTVVGGQLSRAHVLQPNQLLAELQGIVYSPALDADAGDGPHGTSFTQVAGGMYAGESAEVVSQLSRMTGRRYLVLLRYYNGSIVAIGDRLSGLLFTAKYESGQKPGQRKGWSWRFEAVTATPAAYLSAPFQVEGIGLITPGQPVPVTSPSTGAPVPIYNSRGRLLGTAQPGQRIDITSAFTVTVRVS